MDRAEDGMKKNSFIYLFIHNLALQQDNPNRQTAVAILSATTSRPDSPIAYISRQLSGMYRTTSPIRVVQTMQSSLNACCTHSVLHFCIISTEGGPDISTDIHLSL